MFKNRQIKEETEKDFSESCKCKTKTVARVNIKINLNFLIFIISDQKKRVFSWKHSQLDPLELLTIREHLGSPDVRPSVAGKVTLPDHHIQHALAHPSASIDIRVETLVLSPSRQPWPAFSNGRCTSKKRRADQSNFNASAAPFDLYSALLCASKAA